MIALLSCLSTSPCLGFKLFFQCLTNIFIIYITLNISIGKNSSYHELLLQVSQTQVQSSLVAGRFLKFRLQQDKLLRVDLILAGELLIVAGQLPLERDELLQRESLVPPQRFLLLDEFLQLAHFRLELRDRLLRLLLSQLRYCFE